MAKIASSFLLHAKLEIFFFQPLSQFMSSKPDYQPGEFPVVVMPVRDLREALNSLLKKPAKGLDTHIVEMVIKSIDELYIY